MDDLEVNAAGYTRRECRAGGRAANRITDYYIEPKWFEGGVLFGGCPVEVFTPCRGWHEATDRDRRILRKQGLSIWPQPLHRMKLRKAH